MEEEAEKMAALKRAYADIILNTAKESAARILAAERRSLGFQQSLFAAKEDALASMLRLKAVMEDKVRKVEKEARCQEKKIEELELQLGEAEDTIVDLREELKRVRGELTRMKDVSFQPTSNNLETDASLLEEGCCKTLESGKAPEYDGEDHTKFLRKNSPQNQRAFYDQSDTLSHGVLSDSYNASASNSMHALDDEHNIIEAPNKTPSSIPISTEVNDAIEKQCPGEWHTSIKKESMEIKPCTGQITWESVKKKQNLCENEFLQNCFHSEDVKDPLLSSTDSKIGSQACLNGIQNDLVNRTKVATEAREEVENVAECLDNAITIKPDSVVTENGMAHAGTDKFLKYTFQRKKKRGCSPIKNEIEFPEKKPTLKPKHVDKQTSLPVPWNSSVVTDLPRNNRRVVQVARQLISLSEKRW